MHPYNNPFNHRVDNLRNTLGGNLRTLGNRLPKTQVNDEWVTPVKGLTSLIEHVVSVSLEEITILPDVMDQIIQDHSNIREF